MGTIAPGLASKTALRGRASQMFMWPGSLAQQALFWMEMLDTSWLGIQFCQARTLTLGLYGKVWVAAISNGPIHPDAQDQICGNSMLAGAKSDSCLWSGQDDERRGLEI